MKIAEQIRAFELQRKTAADRQAALLELSGGEGRSLSDEEKVEFDALTKDLEEIDGHIERCKLVEKRDAGTAKPPLSRTTPTGTPGNPGKAPKIIIPGADPDDAFPGQSFTRRAIARALAYIDQDHRSPGEIAEARWGKTHPQLVQVIKAGVAAGAGVSGAWASELVTADSRYSGDFIDLLRSMTVFDKLALKQVPANVTIKGRDGDATANWVGEGKAIPVSAQDFNTINLGYLKVAAISVITKELIKHSDPSAEMLVRDGLLNACAQKIDTTFLGSAAAVANVSPAGILNGLAALGSNGTDGASVRLDLGELFAPFLTAKYDTTGLVLVMHPGLAMSLSLMANALGQTEFPGIGPNGGTLLGVRVVTGHNVGATTVILLDPSNIWRIGDTGIEVSMSDQATIEQDSAPAGAAVTPTAASATLMSMFQEDSVAFKVVRPINFQKRRSSAVATMVDVAWGVAGGSST